MRRFGSDTQGLGTTNGKWYADVPLQSIPAF